MPLPLVEFEAGEALVGGGRRSVGDCVEVTGDCVIPNDVKQGSAETTLIMTPCMYMNIRFGSGSTFLLELQADSGLEIN